MTVKYFQRSLSVVPCGLVWFWGKDMQGVVGTFTFVEENPGEFLLTADFPFYRGDVPFNVSRAEIGERLAHAEIQPEFRVCAVAWVVGVKTVSCVTDRSLRLSLDQTNSAEVRGVIEAVCEVLQTAHSGHRNGRFDIHVRYFLAETS